MRLPSLNPFWMCALSFISVLFLYSLQLSTLYGSFGITTVLIILLVIIFTIVGYFFNNKLKGWLIRNGNKSRMRPVIGFNLSVVVVGFLIDCLPTFQIPVVSILRGDIYSYNDFGLKTFHVIYMGYISALAVVSFENFLKFRRLSFLLGFIFPIIVTLLIVNRGALLLIVFPMVFIYIRHLNKSKTLNINAKIIGCVIVFVGIVIFGYLGDKRMISSGYTDEKAILKIGRADPVFESIPTGFFWVYLYASSPMANLIEQESSNNYNKGDLLDFISGAILPDFISKYTSTNIDKRYEFNKITPELTVSTGFGRAVVILGDIGFYLLILWMIFLIFLFAWLNKNFYIRSTCAILSSISVLMVFDNMFIFSSCVMQLVVLTLFSRCRVGNYSLI
ncbi:O-antigen polymerase [Escherichia albertii]|uniref:O-antigen polymerase n=1 Tax=Escherichia albertii TaxID=208962 RepID=UPI001131FCBC|nr:O-antigen polymerase [Escherichia albertii]MCZ8595005.1 O-antigen ligase [Escherichia albertii]WDB26165.1 O-antigen ligase [Escherichia albertii]WDB53457.1 O-antigen ligase [Escherichia albertii]